MSQNSKIGAGLGGVVLTAGAIAFGAFLSNRHQNRGYGDGRGAVPSILRKRCVPNAERDVERGAVGKAGVVVQGFRVEVWTRCADLFIRVLHFTPQCSPALHTALLISSLLVNRSTVENKMLRNNIPHRADSFRVTCVDKSHVCGQESRVWTKQFTCGSGIRASLC